MSAVLTRSATADASSLDQEARTIDVVFATETPVRRSGWGEPYNEVLVISRSAIRADRLNAGLSVLDSHRAGSMANRVGSVIAGSFRIEGGQAIATIRLSRKAAAEELLADLVDGHTLPVSVGYRIHKRTKTEARGDRIAEVRATEWEPLEISIVPVPADANASTRKEHEMPDDKTIETGERQSGTKTKRAAAAERSRIAEIDSLARRFKIDDQEFIDEFKTDGRSVQEFREAIIERRVLEEEASPTYTQVETRGLSDHDDGLAARVDGLIARVTGSAPPEHARQFAQQSLMDHAKGLLEARGVNTSWLTKNEIVERAAYHTASDFPILLTQASNRIFKEAYTLAQSPIRQMLSRQTTLSDFRPKQGVRVTDIGLLKKVNEHGEVSATTRTEVQGEVYGLATYARMFNLTRQAIINDDLGALSDFARTAGRMAAETENEILWSILAENAFAGPTMAEDGTAMFHADHANTGLAVYLEVDSLSGARKMMRTQRALANAGEHRPFLSVIPKYLVVGPELETQAERILSQISATTPENVNPLAGKLQLLVEPRIEDHAWYVFADPASMPVLEHAYLAGQSEPQIATKEGFDVLGVSFRVLLDFGAGAVDHRGAYRNPGAAPN